MIYNYVNITEFYCGAIRGIIILKGWNYMGLQISPLRIALGKNLYFYNIENIELKNNKKKR